MYKDKNERQSKGRREKLHKQLSSGLQSNKNEVKRLLQRRRRRFRLQQILDWDWCLGKGTGSPSLFLSGRRLEPVAQFQHTNFFPPHCPQRDDWPDYSRDSLSREARAIGSPDLDNSQDEMVLQECIARVRSFPFSEWLGWGSGYLLGSSLRSLSQLLQDGLFENELVLDYRWRASIPPWLV